MEEEVAPKAKEKKYRRKTPKQLAQEAVFRAMRDGGLVPEETRLSPELAEVRREAFLAERAAAKERRARRIREAKEQRRRQLQEDSAEERRCAEDFEKVLQERERRREERRQKEQEVGKRKNSLYDLEDFTGNEESSCSSAIRVLRPPGDGEDPEGEFAAGVIKSAEQRRAEKLRHKEHRAQRDQERRRHEQQRRADAEATLRMEEVEYHLRQLQAGAEPATAERLERLAEFAQIGGNVEAAAEVAKTAVQKCSELAESLREVQDMRRKDPEGYADEALMLLAECAVPFFELGVRPPEGAPVLPSDVRNRVKRVRLALRAMILKMSPKELLGDSCPAEVQEAHQLEEAPKEVAAEFQGLRRARRSNSRAPVRRSRSAPLRRPGGRGR